MALETDDDGPNGGRKRPNSDPPQGGLGDLAAGLGSSPPGEHAEEALDAAALAALSKARTAAAQVGGDSTVHLADAKSSLARTAEQGKSEGRDAARSAPAVVRETGFAAHRWHSGALLAALIVGFVAGVPVGGLLLGGGQAEPSTRSAARQPPDVERAPQPSAAEPSAQPEGDPTAAVRLPLPGPNARRAPDPGVLAADDPAAEGAQPSAAGIDPRDPNAADGTQAALATRDTQPTAAADGNARAAAPTVARTQHGDPAAAAHAAAHAATMALATAAAAAPEAPAAAEAAPPPAAPKPAVPAGPDQRSVDELLDQALANSGGQRTLPERAHAPPPAAPGLPATPSRDDVTRAMSVLLPAIRGCAGGESGLATVGIVVKNDGHVESAAVSGAPFEGARSGRCMEGVVRKAKFPRFQQSSFRIQFPFAIQ